jgi:hypothetical protein
MNTDRSFAREARRSNLEGLTKAAGVLLKQTLALAEERVHRLSKERSVFIRVNPWLNLFRI